MLSCVQESFHHDAEEIGFIGADILGHIVVDLKEQKGKVEERKFVNGKEGGGVAGGVAVIRGPRMVHSGLVLHDIAIASHLCFNFLFIHQPNHPRRIPN